LRDFINRNKSINRKGRKDIRRDRREFVGVENFQPLLCVLCAFFVCFAVIVFNFSGPQLYIPNCVISFVEIKTENEFTY